MQVVKLCRAALQKLHASRADKCSLAKYVRAGTGVCDAAVSNHDVPVTPQALCWLKHLACQCLLPDSMSIFSRCGSAVWALLLSLGPNFYDACSSIARNL